MRALCSHLGGPPHQKCHYTHSRSQVIEDSQVERDGTEILDIELLIPDIENSFTVRFVCAYVCERVRACAGDRATLWSWFLTKKVWETEVWADLGFACQRDAKGVACLLGATQKRKGGKGVGDFMEALGGTITLISTPDPPQLPFNQDPQACRPLAASKIQQPPG